MAQQTSGEAKWGTLGHMPQDRTSCLCILHRSYYKISVPVLCPGIDCALVMPVQQTPAWQVNHQTSSLFEKWVVANTTNISSEHAALFGLSSLCPLSNRLEREIGSTPG